MAIKTFTTGEVLTASDTNTYLANSGLVYIASGSLSGTPTNVANVFSSTYDNYRIVFSNMSVAAGATASYIQLSVGGTAAITNYNYGGTYTLFAAAGTGMLGGGGSFMYIAQTSTSPISGCVMEIQRPFIAGVTTFQGQSANYDSGAVCSGNHTTATAYDGFKVSSQSSTPSFSYAVYGYRKA
jgi:hypothetical protein